jgi:hypothetical protein
MANITPQQQHDLAGALSGRGFTDQQAGDWLRAKAAKLGVKNISDIQAEHFNDIKAEIGTAVSPAKQAVTEKHAPTPKPHAKSHSGSKPLKK